MSGGEKYIKAQLLGLKSLPHESGAWGFLLPRRKEQATHEPDAHEQVQDINPAYLTFVDSEMNVDGGMWLTIGIFISSYMLLGAITFLPPLLARLNLDSSYPFVFRSKLVSTAGTTTIYTLQLAEIDTDRTIVESAVLGPFSRLPDECARRWEFIRRYMNSEPDKVPPVLTQPPVNDRRATLARMDRIGSSGLVGRDFRLKKGLFAWSYFCFHGIVSYWWLRAAAWMHCRGKYPEYSVAMRDAMTFEGPNAYPRKPLSAIEKAAFDGRLPHLRIRWAVIGVLSTLLWGGSG